MNPDYPTIPSVDIALIRASERRAREEVRGNLTGVIVLRHVEDRLLDRRLVLMRERDAVMR